MQHTGFSSLAVLSLAAALAAAGCGSAKSATGPDEASAPAPRTGAAVIEGTIAGGGFGASSTPGVRALAAGSGLTVSVVGTAVSGAVDEEGHFALTGVPAGTVTLRFEGSGVDARLEVSGLVDGQVLSIRVQLTGARAQMTSPPACAPTKDVEFSGLLESVAGTRLVVGGRTVETSTLRADRDVWRGDRRIHLSDLQIGEKVKVYGTLGGDGVVRASGIVALTRGSGSQAETWVSFTGRVESVVFAAFSISGDLSASCSYPTLIVKGTKVLTNDRTVFRHSDNSRFDPSEIRVGQQVLVEGWKHPRGWVAATMVML